MALFAARWTVLTWTDVGIVRLRLAPGKPFTSYTNPKPLFQFALKDPQMLGFTIFLSGLSNDEAASDMTESRRLDFGRFSTLKK